jgi:hypothetical protein
MVVAMAHPYNHGMMATALVVLWMSEAFTKKTQRTELPALSFALSCKHSISDRMFSAVFDRGECDISIITILWSRALHRITSPTAECHCACCRLPPREVPGGRFQQPAITVTAVIAFPSASRQPRINVLCNGGVRAESVLWRRPARSV